MSTQKFAGKTVIVTGSSSGIGQGIALLLAQQGASITIHGRSAEGLKETEDLILESGVSAEKIHKVQGDLADEEVLKKLIDETVAKFGKLDVVVNNAGLLSKIGTELSANFDRVFHVNVKAVMALNALAIPHLEKTKGNIVNVSSVGSTRVFNDEHYCMSKAALDHYMRFQAQTLAKKGIRMNNLNPGFVNTNLSRDMGLSKEKIGELTETFTKTLVPLERSGTPLEQANCVSFLASEEASYVTGITLVCDGGFLLGKEHQFS
ncbi:hypothetical protein L596_026801 [Steinernema carpocapsae]|uniref:Ketoreductase domain-containing protein n=1 Tax=Steinernema carpocapsae TaxID=34508 RepID=A0A4U5M2E9_STECR|nr:hypothetical protein L596_026801 [Steinernema carpocapsae]